MNIKRAKQEIKDTIEAYLLKDERGEYRIPFSRQRPVFLTAPSGIGKTQIIEQIARECGINLVSYTMTHFRKEKEYCKDSYFATEYIIGEMIESVYDKIKETEVETGILFLDEMNGVSEIFTSAMLHFLQYKTFGNRKLPEGWIIVIAGDMSENCKSSCELNLPMLDRIKKIEVEDDFGAWKEYAYEVGIHAVVISYLNFHKENFYRVEVGQEGKQFATARSWEDLSELLSVYEKLGKTVDEEVVIQYLQHEEIAKDFVKYLNLFTKNQMDYQIDTVFEGTFVNFAIEKLRMAAYEERFCVIGFFIGKLNEKFRTYHNHQKYMNLLSEMLKKWEETLSENQKASVLMGNILDTEKQKLEERQSLGQIIKEDEYIWLNAIECFENYKEIVDTLDIVGESKKIIVDTVKEKFQEEQDIQEKEKEILLKNLQNIFDFLEKAFADEQEMVLFLTELHSSPYSLEFISENRCDSYYK